MIARLKAFGLPSLLLIVVAITHLAPDLMGSFYPGREVPAAKAWQLVFRGGEAFLLYLIVWSLVPWKPVIVRIACSVACAWGAIESLQISVCRAAFDMTRPPAEDTELYKGLCNYVTGFPIYGITMVIIAVMTTIYIYRDMNRARDERS